MPHGLPAGVINDANPGTVFDVGWMPDGQSIFSAGSGGSARRWRVRGRTLIADIGRPRGPVYDVAFSPADSIFASPGAESDVLLWSAADGAWLQRLPGHRDVVNAIAFSPDGRLLPTAVGAERADIA